MTMQQQLGMRISYLRKQVNWSQEELAFRSNIHKNYLSDLENGRRNPSLLVLTKIAKAFNISIALLFKGLEIFDDKINL